MSESILVRKHNEEVREESFQHERRLEKEQKNACVFYCKRSDLFFVDCLTFLYTLIYTVLQLGAGQRGMLQSCRKVPQFILLGEAKKW